MDSLLFQSFEGMDQARKDHRAFPRALLEHGLSCRFAPPPRVRARVWRHGTGPAPDSPRPRRAGCADAKEFTTEGHGEEKQVLRAALARSGACSPRVRLKNLPPLLALSAASFAFAGGEACTDKAMCDAKCTQPCCTKDAKACTEAKDMKACAAVAKFVSSSVGK